MKIRPYQPSDRETCLAIFKSNMPQFFAPNELPDFETWLESQETSQLAYKNTKEEPYFVVEKAGEVVACGGYYLKATGNQASMTWGMVRNDLHRQGIGKALFRYRLEEIFKKCPDCSVALDTTQHSYQFFLKAGFEVTKITKDSYGPGLDRYDMVKTSA